MENNKEFFRLNWKQNYPEWQEAIDREMNNMLELSNFKEANEIIANIKNRLKND